MKPIPYGRQHISDEDIQAVVETLRSDFLTQGPKIDEFEKAFAQYVGAPYAVAVSNGTAALHLSALALGVGPGIKVLTTPNTFAASANCVLYCGGAVDFVDIDPQTYLMDVEALEKKLKQNKYAGIIPVDFAGLPVNMEDVRHLAKKYGLWIIEDACHAPGAEFRTQKGTSAKVGSGEFADLSIFSFHPVKHIATGEGGMITTRDAKLYEKLRLLRTHGITKDSARMSKSDGGWFYEMQTLGYNYRIADFQCALGLSQLKRADTRLQKRRAIAQKYFDLLSPIKDLKLPFVPEGANHAWHLFVVRHPRRRELFDFLKSRQIHAQVHYVPVHLHPYYQSLGFKAGMFPNAENFYSECLSIPMFPELTDSEIQYVAQTFKDFSEKAP